ncbi:glycosyltransferase [Neobacillus sp. C211]|uniref:glycosyltransferase n=1 Tax=unclassified Neobacillus TaxID=2675272 RepID=UPI003978D24E
MISIIACTNREKFVSNIIANFQKQTFKEKELILVLNSSKMNFKQIERELDEAKLNSQLFQFPDEMSLGECLNKGAEQANFEYIGKMDDDDYYGSSYLKEAFEALMQTKAELVGKSSFYIYFKKKQELRLYNPHHENSWIINNGQNLYKTSHFLSGATLIFKKRTFGKSNIPTRESREGQWFSATML